MASESPATGIYTWRIKYFPLMYQKKYYSDVFTVGSCKWRLLIFPKGNGSEVFAIYLDVPDSATLLTGWAREASITFDMVNQKDRSGSTRKCIVFTTFGIVPIGVRMRKLRLKYRRCLCWMFIGGQYSNNTARENCRFYGSQSLSAPDILLGSLPSPPAAAILHHALYDMYQRLQG